MRVAAFCGPISVKGGGRDRSRDNWSPESVQKGTGAIAGNRTPGVRQLVLRPRFEKFEGCGVSSLGWWDPCRCGFVRQNLSPVPRGTSR